MTRSDLLQALRFRVAPPKFSSISLAGDLWTGALFRRG